MNPNHPVGRLCNRFALLAVRCPACNSETVRRSGRRNRFERAISALILPWRCEVCNQRWFRLGK